MTRRFSSRLFAAASCAAFLAAAGVSAKGFFNNNLQNLTNKQIADKLKLAPIEKFTLTVKPDTLFVGATAAVELIMRPGKKFIDSLPQLQTPGGVPQPQVTGVMKASLDVGFAFEVTPDEPVEKGVTAQGVTRWQWTVRALEAGNQTLTARLTTPVTFEGKETEVDVRSIAHSVVVNPAPTTSIPFTAHVLKFLGGNWQWLWAAILVPAAGWLWKRRKSKTRQANAG